MAQANEQSNSVALDPAAISLEETLISLAAALCKPLKTFCSAISLKLLLPFCERSLTQLLISFSALFNISPTFAVFR